MRFLIVAWAVLLGCTPTNPTAVDAGNPDAGSIDAGNPDGGSPDAGQPLGDAGVLPAEDCALSLDEPLPYTILPGPGQSEDFVFDDDGMLTITNGNLVRHLTSGEVQVVVPGVIVGNIHGDPTSHGFAMMPGGDIIVADSGAGSLLRVNPSTGSVSTIITDLPFPNGVAIDQDGGIYATLVAGAPGSGAQWGIDNFVNAGVVIRVDVNSGAHTIVADNLTLPNGLAFSADFRTLHIGSHEPGGFVYNLDVATNALTTFVSGVGQEGSLDGITADRCGNVYVTEIGAGAIWRISADASEVKLVASVQGDGFWIPNLHFGSGLNGWSNRNLYVIDYQSAQTYVIEVDVPGVVASPR